MKIKIIIALILVSTQLSCYKKIIEKQYLSKVYSKNAYYVSCNSLENKLDNKTQREIPKQKFDSCHRGFWDIQILSECINLPTLYNGCDSNVYRIWYPDKLKSKIHLFDLTEFMNNWEISYYLINANRVMGDSVQYNYVLRHLSRLNEINMEDALINLKSLDNDISSLKNLKELNIANDPVLIKFESFLDNKYTFKSILFKMHAKGENEAKINNIIDIFCNYMQVTPDFKY